MKPYLLLPLLWLAGCALPPPGAYVAESASTKPEQQVSLGQNTVGEPCTQGAASAASADIYCGAWEQPSGHVRSAGPAAIDSLPGLATSSPWRTGLSSRYDCQEPRTGALPAGPAVFMDCVRRIGGWPYFAFVVLANGQAWQGDGVLPSLPAVERSVAVLSGQQTKTLASGAGADELVAGRLAARAFSSGDIGQYDALMLAGYRANLADNPVAAAQAYAAALSLQEKALGRDDPATADAMSHLALQLSLEGRYAEAGALFARATRLAPRAADMLLPARVLHYRALDALNQGRNLEALALLRQASSRYSDPRLVSAEAFRPPDTRFRNDITSTLGGSAAGLADLDTRRALAALVDVRRYEGIVLHRLGREQESKEALTRAEQLVSRSDTLQTPLLVARLARSEALSEEFAGNTEASASALSRSNLAFVRAMPGTKPAALVAVLHGRQLMRLGRSSDALENCRAGVEVLRELHATVEPTQMAGCLDAYLTAADAIREPQERQALLAEMFGAAQLAQSGITTQYILRASARLTENARDPRAAEAIRKRDTATAALADAERRRETTLASAGQSSKAADLDREVSAARAALLDADAALQAASPRYNQLVQPAVSAADVLAALRPGQAFAAIVLAGGSGWTFVLRDGAVRVAKVPGGENAVDALVRRVRASMVQANPMPAFDSKAAQGLYDLTFGAMPGSLDGAQALVVAPTGSLLSLPFEVLLTGPAEAANLAKAPWLVRQLTIAHVTSASNFLALRRTVGGSRAARPWFGFGDARPVTLAQASRSFPPSCGESASLLAGLPPLPGARRELAMARDILHGDGRDQLLGAEFTATTVEREPLKNYRMLHFAAHASLPTDLRCESEPALITSTPSGAADARGALLTASDIDRLDLDADLVILSACNSGGPGGTTAGDSLSGLARSFFSAGARALLVSHWNVNDEAALILISATLVAMRDEHLGVAGALRAVQLALLDDAANGQTAEFAHPFFWSPFAVIGEGGVQTVVVGNAR